MSKISELEIRMNDEESERRLNLNPDNCVEIDLSEEVKAYLELEVQ